MAKSTCNFMKYRSPSLALLSSTFMYNTWSAAVFGKFIQTLFHRFLLSLSPFFYLLLSLLNQFWVISNSVHAPNFTARNFYARLLMKIRFVICFIIQPQKKQQQITVSIFVCEWVPTEQKKHMLVEKWFGIEAIKNDALSTHITTMSVLFLLHFKKFHDTQITELSIWEWCVFHLIWNMVLKCFR